MPRDPEEGTIRTTHGKAPKAQQVTGKYGHGVEIPEERSESPQRPMSTQRKPWGPPLADDAGLHGHEVPEPDVAETEPRDEAPQTGGEGRY